MPEEIEPTPPPASPANLAELLPFLPVTYEYGHQWALVFSEELAAILEEKQGRHECCFLARPMELVDGRWMLSGDLLSEVPHGLYATTFAALDAARFSEIAIIPLDDALALLPPSPEPKDV